MLNKHRLKKRFLVSSAASILLTLSFSTFANEILFDDLIIQGNVCIGASCEPGEDLKSNVATIKGEDVKIIIEDTSNAEPFSTQDWQISFNDPSGGTDNNVVVSIIDSEGNATPIFVLTDKGDACISGDINPN